MKNTFLIPWVSLLLLCLVVNNSLSGQCNSTAYSTKPKDSWLSCQTSMNPNNSRGDSHWLKYDLGYVYELGMTKFWNYNVTNLTGRGFKQVAIDYSLDGVSWIAAGVFQLPEADENANYAGVEGIDLSNITARYVLITALSNWNGGICAGLSEVKFEVSNPSSTCGDFIVTQKIEGETITAGVYYGTNEIDVDGTVKTATEVMVKSANSINLKVGFTVEAGSQFLAKIEPCNSLKNSEAGNQHRQTLTPLENNSTITDIRIYPNPTVHLLNIDLGEIEITDLMILNSTGHEILRRTGDEKIQQIDVSQLPAGMYFINVLTNRQQLITKRFIKPGL